MLSCACASLPAQGSLRLFRLRASRHAVFRCVTAFHSCAAALCLEPRGASARFGDGGGAVAIFSCAIQRTFSPL